MLCLSYHDIHLEICDNLFGFISRLQVLDLLKFLKRFEWILLICSLCWMRDETKKIHMIPFDVRDCAIFRILCDFLHTVFVDMAGAGIFANLPSQYIYTVWASGAAQKLSYAEREKCVFRIAI